MMARNKLLGNACSAVGPTDQTLSCTARALVPKPERHAARCMWGARMRAAWRREFLTFRAGSAGGPKPGRASFCGELGRRW